MQDHLSKEPWEMTQKEYLNYHTLGTLPETTYEKTVWFGPGIERNRLLVKEEIFDSMKIEFRQSGEENKYVRIDSAGEVIRTDEGLVTYLTEDEMNKSKLPLYDTTVTAYHNREPIGYASDEWGVDGVWVKPEYQKKGIGVELLSLLRKQFSPEKERKIGQMTPAGIKMTEAYHRKLVQEALHEGRPVPEGVLAEYPRLISVKGHLKK